MELIAALPLSLAVSLMVAPRWAECKPRFTTQPQDTEARDGTNATFTCSAEGEEPLLLVWQIKDVIVSSSTVDKTITTSKTSLNQEMVQRDSRIVLHDVNLDVGNRYVACVAHDKSGVAVISRKVGLAVTHISKSVARPTIQPTPPIVMKTKIRMECVIPHGFPPPSITWLKNGESISLDTRITTSSNITQQRAWLLFNHTVPLDSGMYICQAENIVGTVKSSPLELIVTTPSARYAPVVAVTPQNVIVADNGVGFFTCQGWGNPTANLTWTKSNGAALPDNKSRFNVSGDVIKITAPTGSGRAKARCHAENDEGSANEKVTVYWPDSPLDFQLRPSDKTVVEFRSVSFNCSEPKDTYPKPKIIWMTKGKVLTYSHRIRFNEGPGWSELRMRFVTQEDGGTYICNVSTPYNSTTASATLTVLRSAAVLVRANSITKPDRNVDTSEMARLYCEVISNSELVTITWEHRQKNSPVRTFDRSTNKTGYHVTVDGTLEIAKPQSEDSGQWSCKLPNGSSAGLGAYVNVTVIGRPVLTEKLPSEMVVNISQTLTLHCTGSGIPLPKITWQVDLQNIAVGNGSATLILNVTADMHNKVYRCIAGNTHGLAQEETKVVIGNLPNNNNNNNNKGSGGSSSSDDDDLAVTIGIAVPCAIIYIIVMILLVLYCQRRRYSLRSSKDSSQEDVGDGGREAKELETMKEVDEEEPPEKVLGGKRGDEEAPVAVEVKDEPVRCKPPSLHLDEPASTVKPASPTLTLKVVQSAPLPETVTLYRAPPPIGIDRQKLSAIPSFKREHCKLVRQLGKGYFTEFFEAHWRQSGLPASQDTLMLTQFSASKLDATGYEEDILSLTSIHHKNICTCLAVNMDAHPYMILSEYLMQGNLKTVLHEREASGKPILFHQQLSTLLQLCDALQYLAAQRFTHRDVAAHSCLVGEDMLVKLAFYSRSFEGHPQDYYSEKDGHEPLPVRWMAPETLETKQFTSQSDLWSFGVLMWEVFSHGQQPYADVKDADIQDHIQVQAHRLQRPSSCPDLAYQAMKGCWQQDPSERLIFSQISSRLHQLHTEL